MVFLFFKKPFVNNLKWSEQCEPFDWQMKLWKLHLAMSEEFLFPLTIWRSLRAGIPSSDSNIPESPGHSTGS